MSGATTQQRVGGSSSRLLPTPTPPGRAIRLAGRSEARRARRPRAMGFEAPPMTTTLVLLSAPAGLAFYWWSVLVPSERRSLAKSKRRGALNTYLEDLEGDETRGLERWFYTDYLDKRAAKKRTKTTGMTDEDLVAEDCGEDERDEEPDFFSLDNPLVNVFLAIATVALVSALARAL